MSFRTAVKLNAWAIVAILFSALGHGCARMANADPALLAAITLAPLLPGFLYARALWRWISTLDEMQRRIQQEAWLFAATGTSLVATALSLLADRGLLNGGLGWEGACAVGLGLWMIGSVMAARRCL